MVCQSKRKLKALDCSQDSTVEPLGQCQWKQHIRNLRCGPTHFMYCLSPLTNTSIPSIFLFPSIIYTLYTYPPMLSSSYCQNSARKIYWLMERTSLLVVWLSRGKFSGSDPDGTCGCVESHCSFVPLQRLGLEIPLPMPSQHHNSSTAIAG